MDNAIETIKHFFSVITAEEAKCDLERLVHVALTTDNSEYSTGKERGNLLEFHKHLGELLEAAYELARTS